MAEKCSDCRFYLPGDDENGLCRRYPPAVVADVDQEWDQDSGWGGISSTAHHLFPVVEGMDWCGEFKESNIQTVNQT